MNCDHDYSSILKSVLTDWGLFDYYAYKYQYYAYKLENPNDPHITRLLHKYIRVDPVIEQWFDKDVVSRISDFISQDAHGVSLDTINKLADVVLITEFDDHRPIVYINGLENRFAQVRIESHEINLRIAVNYFLTVRGHLVRFDRELLNSASRSILKNKVKHLYLKAVVNQVRYAR